MLCIVEADDDDAAKALLEPLRRVWVECLKLEGLGGTMARAFHLASGEAVTEYVGKHDSEIEAGSWGIAEEMTLGRLKRGRGEKGASPWQVLREAHAGDDEARALWCEYALTMHGRRQQVWSNGLKATVGLVEVEDEKAAEGEEYSDDLDELMHRFDRDQWRRWRPQRAAILAAARQGPEAVAVLLRGGADDLGDVIEDEAAPVSMPRPVMPSGGLAERAMAAATSPKKYSPHVAAGEVTTSDEAPPASVEETPEVITKQPRRHIMVTKDLEPKLLADEISKIMLSVALANNSVSHASTGLHLAAMDLKQRYGSERFSPDLMEQWSADLGRASQILQDVWDQIDPNFRRVAREIQKLDLPEVAAADPSP